jgi:hypothetical protein
MTGVNVLGDQLNAEMYPWYLSWIHHLPWASEVMPIETSFIKADGF